MGCVHNAGGSPHPRVCLEIMGGSVQYAAGGIVHLHQPVRVCLSPHTKSPVNNPPMKEFKVRYSRGTGPGGQHKNKVETCVVIIHLKSGLQEKCEDTRSRARNQNIAMGRLLRRLEEVKLAKEAEVRNTLRKEQIKAQRALRTYNYARSEVVDHRTGKRANLRKVLDGDIDLLK